jgi:hypothetical protein
MEETVSWMRDRSARPRLIPPPDATTTSASITPGRAEEENEEVAAEAEPEFYFPSPEALPKVVDAAEVLDQFAAQFLEATMGATSGPRTAELKKELLLNRRVVDVVGLERWLRKVEALAELAWFTELCSDEDSEVPPLELFECAFRALEGACSDELHRDGADARRFWIGPVAVLEFFLCPLSKKVMENPVVITSGKVLSIFHLASYDFTCSDGLFDTNRCNECSTYFLVLDGHCIHPARPFWKSYLIGMFQGTDFTFCSHDFSVSMILTSVKFCYYCSRVN